MGGDRFQPYRGKTLIIARMCGNKSASPPLLEQWVTHLARGYSEQGIAASSGEKRVQKRKRPRGTFDHDTLSGLFLLPDLLLEFFLGQRLVAQ